MIFFMQNELEKSVLFQTPTELLLPTSACQIYTLLTYDYAPTICQMPYSKVILIFMSTRGVAL